VRSPSSLDAQGSVGGDGAPQLVLSHLDEGQRSRELIAVLFAAEEDMATQLGLSLTWRLDVAHAADDASVAPRRQPVIAGEKTVEGAGR